MSKLFSTLPVALLACVCARAASFQNLGFDAGNTNTPLLVETDKWYWGQPEEFLPGWQITAIGTQAAGLVGVDAQPPGFGFVTLYDGRLLSSVEGKFALGLLPSHGGSYTISQRGDIPFGAQAIRFTGFDAHVELAIDGTPVPLVYVPRGARSPLSDVYGDISAFGGKTVDVAFTSINTSIAVPDSGLDSISFVVPEPRSWVLIGIGCIGLARLPLRRRHKAG
jgi:hypothetical protein